MWEKSTSTYDGATMSRTLVIPAANFLPILSVFVVGAGPFLVAEVIEGEGGDMGEAGDTGAERGAAIGGIDELIGAADAICISGAFGAKCVGLLV